MISQLFLRLSQDQGWTQSTFYLARQRLKGRISIPWVRFCTKRLMILRSMAGSREGFDNPILFFSRHLRIQRKNDAVILGAFAFMESFAR